MSIRGHVSVLETPNLARVGALNAPEPNGMEVLANCTDLQGVFLDGLEEAYGGLWFDGYIGRVNLGQMVQTDAPITIRARSPMSIDSTLQDAGVLDLSGEFEAINFSDIATAESLTITTTSSTKCASNLVEVYSTLNSPREASFCSEDTASPSSSTSSLGEGLDDLLNNDDDERSSTRWTPPSFEDVYGDRDDDKGSSPRNHGIPTAVIVLIPVIVGVTCCGLAWCCASKCATKRKEKQQQQGQQESSGDLEASIQQVQPAVVRDPHEFSNDLPPPYSVDTPTQERSRYF
ncbi:uncharacterized protein LDX57_010316 [Aspergillus melleus]|uniref:uncharacterized protein n=1 Tax=Aspergillus melleus TaxID=138277 RepID=UPI001E8D7C40|nr:uncharacterized protein LDX57_010316 [Aspergillus melleus]KAH8432689.1 hypothetical protein LDX57_010316 [Aspergillus melleus]